MGKLNSRKENNSKVDFIYNTEEQLVGIRNEDGHIYSFELDENGDVELEIGFDGIRRYYKRNAVGKVTQLVRESGIETIFGYDEKDKVISIRHLENNQEISWEKYIYREDGKLIEAQNEHSQIKFERDALGRVEREWSGAYWIDSKYDIQGVRTQVSSILGAQVSFGHDKMGSVENIQAQMGSGTWECKIQRDEFGLTMNQDFSGGLSVEFVRDFMGRLNEQRVFEAGSNNNPIHRRQYDWDQNNRLKSLKLDDKILYDYGYDGVGNLIWSRDKEGIQLNRFADGVGNLFIQENHEDRQYGAAGKLLEKEGTTFRYDTEGNLIEKKLSNGETWTYQWSPSGKLKEVIRPDGEKVSFTYDPFGRRISKSFSGKVTRWIWDRDVPLHEWEDSEEEIPTPVSSGGQDSGITFFGNDILLNESLNHEESNSSLLPHSYPFPSPDSVLAHHKDSLITWVYEQGSFTPISKSFKGSFYSVVSDHLGVPVSMYDEHQNEVWSADLDIYAGYKSKIGDRISLPFRHPGQYEDHETGLYYNRFRYYSPKEGIYISQDPIRFWGGLNPYSFVKDLNRYLDVFGLSSFDPWEVGEITDFPEDIHFGQDRIAPNFSSVGSQAGSDIVGRSIEDVASDMRAGDIDINDTDNFLISYTVDPKTGKAVTLNNRGLAALAEADKYPSHAIKVPWDKVPPHLVEDIADRPPSKTIRVTANKDGSGFRRNVTCK